MVEGAEGLSMLHSQMWVGLTSTRHTYVNIGILEGPSTRYHVVRGGKSSPSVDCIYCPDLWRGIMGTQVLNIVFSIQNILPSRVITVQRDPIEKT